MRRNGSDYAGRGSTAPGRRFTVPTHHRLQLPRPVPGAAANTRQQQQFGFRVAPPSFHTPPLTPLISTPAAVHASRAQRFGAAPLATRFVRAGNGGSVPLPHATYVSVDGRCAPPSIPPCLCSQYGEWQDWPLVSVDNNFVVTRVFLARFTRFHKTLILRGRVRGRYEFADQAATLSLPPGYRNTANGGSESFAIVENDTGLTFAQLKVLAGSDSFVVCSTVFTPGVLYTLTFQMILEIDD